MPASGTMRAVFDHVDDPPMRALRFWWLALLLIACGAASAQRMEGDRASASGAYAAEVPVNGQGAGERNGAFARGLAQVLGKLSGNRNAASLPGVGGELRRAGEYVKRYDYRQDEGVSATGAPSFKTVLVVEYDPKKVAELAQTFGVPVWPTPRPKPVLWLAIDDGSGPRLVALQQANAARPALNRATERGYRLGLPNGTAAETAAVGAIWRGDTAAIARLSARYSPPMQLIGKLARDKGGWKADWVFVDGGKVLSRWTSTDADARRAMAAGADGAADALVKRYAKRSAGAGPAGTYRITFTGLASADDYIRLVGHLQSLSVVRRVTPVSAAPGQVVFDLDLVSGLAGFRRLAAGDVLAAEGEGATTTYRMR